MDIYVLNDKLEKIAVVDTFISFIWTDRYIGAGDFEVCLVMDKSLLDIFVYGYYLVNSESEHLMIIETLNIKSDVDDGTQLIVSGRSIESLLDRRIIWNQTILLEANLQIGIRRLLIENMIDPDMTERKIDFIKHEMSTDERIKALPLSTQYWGENLYDAIYTLCNAYNIGFKMTLNDQNQFVFVLYMGIDRSFEQSTHSYVIFSPEFDNIINTNYLESKETYKNVALVGGEGEGDSKDIVIVGFTRGVERREIYVDASNTSTNVGEDIEMTVDDYLDQLRQKGNDELSKNKEIKAFEGEIEATKTFKYGVDFFIGDIVQTMDEYGHSNTVRITEYVISQNESGLSMYPTFETVTKGEDKNE